MFLYDKACTNALSYSDEMHKTKMNLGNSIFGERSWLINDGSVCISFYTCLCWKYYSHVCSLTNCCRYDPTPGRRGKYSIYNYNISTRARESF